MCAGVVADMDFAGDIEHGQSEAVLLDLDRIVSPRGDHPVHDHFRRPIDDENNRAWSFDDHPTLDLTAEERKAMEEVHGIHVRYVLGTYIRLQSKTHNYLMDRTAQKAGLTYSGVRSIGMHDASPQKSIGPIQDRTRKNPVSTDNGITMARRRMMKAAKVLAEKGYCRAGRTRNSSA